MGQEESGAGFRESDWRLLNRTPRCTTWQNVRHPTQRIEEYQTHSNGQQETDRLKSMYYLRKSHRSIVAALYLSNHSNQGLCSVSQTYSIFLQRIPIRLADIEHVPFPDYLHIYGQCLRGYSELCREAGYFVVEEEFIGINQEGVVKVWLDEDTSKTYLIGGRVNEGVMVRSILDAIHHNIDQSTSNSSLPPVRNYLYRNADSLTFQQANQQFQHYLREHQLVEPDRLECIDQVGGIDVIANRPREDSKCGHDEGNSPLYPVTQKTIRADLPSVERPAPQHTLTRQRSDLMVNHHQRQPQITHSRSTVTQTPTKLSKNSSVQALHQPHFAPPQQPMSYVQSPVPPRPAAVSTISVPNRPEVRMRSGVNQPYTILPPHLHQGAVQTLHASQAPPTANRPLINRDTHSIHMPPTVQAPIFHRAQQLPEHQPVPHPEPPPKKSLQQNQPEQSPLNPVSSQLNNRQSVPSFLRKNSSDKLKRQDSGGKSSFVPKSSNFRGNSSGGRALGNSPPLSASPERQEGFLQAGQNSTGMLHSFNPGQMGGAKNQAGDETSSLRFKNFNIEEGKSSAHFLKQLEAIKEGPTETYAPIDYERWVVRNSSSETASFMPGAALSQEAEIDSFRGVGETQSQSIVDSYAHKHYECEGGNSFNAIPNNSLLSANPGSKPYFNSEVQTSSVQRDSGYSPHRKFDEE